MPVDAEAEAAGAISVRCTIWVRLTSALTAVSAFTFPATFVLNLVIAATFAIGTFSRAETVVAADKARTAIGVAVAVCVCHDAGGAFASTGGLGRAARQQDTQRQNPQTPFADRVPAACG